MPTFALRKTALVLSLSMGVGLIGSSALAQPQGGRQIAPGYPAKPIRVIVGVSPGGGMDTVTRMVTGRVAEQLPVSVIVENITGATGAIAVNTVINAPPDGYTLLAVSGALHIGAAFRKFEQDVRSTLQAVQQMSYQPFMVIARSNAPFNNMKELIAYAKANPGKVNYGSSGLGSPIHMGTALLEFVAGIDMVHVPYKGGSGANVDLAAGRLDMTLTAISGLQLVRAGKARALGITSAQRLPEHPDVPAVAETVPGFEVINGYAIYAPIRTPAPIVSAWNREVQRVLATDEVKKKLVADASTPGPVKSPAEWQKEFVAEVTRWEAVVKKAGIKLED